MRDDTYAIAGAAIAGTGNVRSVNLADVNRLLDAGSHTGTVAGEKTYTVAQYRARLQSYIDQIGGVDEPDEPDTPTTPDDPDTPAAQPKIHITSQGEGLILYSDGEPGDIIYLTVAKADGWELESITATSEGTDVPLYLDPITKDYLMTMPDADVTVHAVFRRAGAEEPAESPSIRVEVEGSEGGYVSMPASAEPNTTVSGTILPKDGWWLYSATAEAGGRDLPFSLDVDEGVWKFAMPDEDVTIKVVFMPDTDEPDEPEPDEPAEIPGADTSEDDEDGTDTGFSDVKADDWFADAVAWAVEADAMKGYEGSDKFGPNDKLSRAMMAQTLWGLAGKPAVSLGDGLPSDVAAADWYASSAAWSFQTGIFSGYGDNMFGPNDFITREQAATVLWRRAGTPASSQNLNIFPDADMTSSYAVDAMRWAVENGVFTGSEQNGQKLLDPTGNCTRAQLATILMRMDEAGTL